MVLTATGSALVAGSFTEKSMQTQRVKVVRAFYHERKLQKPDTELTLPRTLALEMQAAEKVTFVEEPKKATPQAKKDGEAGDKPSSDPAK